MYFRSAMLFIICVIPISLSSNIETIKIIETNPAQALVKQGDSVTLSCRPSHPWFLCLWAHPSGRKACSIQEGGKHRSVCSGLDNTEVLAVEDTCQLEIKNISVADHGVYMCLFSQAGVFHTDREHISVEVATPAKTFIRKVGELEEREHLDLLEGEEVQLVCTATEGYPAPQYHWTLVPSKDQTDEVSEVKLEATMVVNGSSYLNYTAKTSHSGWSIMCLARQMDMMEVLYSSKQNMSLSVTKAEPLYADMTSKKGVLTGIFMSSILIILCVAAVLIFLLKRNKKTDVGTDLRPVTKLAIWSPHGNIKAESLYSRPSASTRQSSIEECMVEMPESSSSSSSATTNTPPGSICSSPSLNRTQSVGDIVEGNFISFSPSDMYSRTPVLVNIETRNVEDSHIVADNSFKTSTLLSSTSQTDQSGGHWEEGSEGGVSVISVFDCQHGCFNPDHALDHCQQHRYLEEVAE